MTQEEILALAGEPTKFKRENKYLVLKLGDIAKFLTRDEQFKLDELIKKIRVGRLNDGKQDQSYVCVASDWPMYEQVWAALRDVAAERQRQLSVEGWTPEHDDEHATGGIAAAAACYALWASAPNAENAYWYAAREEAAKMLWPWDREWWKPKSQRRDLVKAGALILAEIERIDRAAARSPEGEKNA